ncbi:MAG: DUF1836 domain-containing protein [Clostridia bacterium]|nr:DUF1836 domain-containing protein [Clostridia bacterium]
MDERLHIDLPRWDALPDIGLYMDQVITLTERTFAGALPSGEITKSMVNNYVKSGLLPRPEGKKYGREHLALLMEIAVLKQALSMEDVARAASSLCGCGAEAGYAFFRDRLRDLECGAQEGIIRVETGAQDEARRMLEWGMAAAVCIIRARRGA